jgi:hypothetical protein
MVSATKIIAIGMTIESRSNWVTGRTMGAGNASRLLE